MKHYISGIVPISEAKTICAGSEKFYKMCESNEVRSKEYQISNNAYTADDRNVNKSMKAINCKLKKIYRG